MSGMPGETFPDCVSPLACEPRCTFSRKEKVFITKNLSEISINILIRVNELT